MPRSKDPGFDEDVIGFVVSGLRTVWALELLVLMRGAQEIWSLAGLTRELRANLAMVEEIMRRLEALKLVARYDEGWLYRPQSAALEDLCDRTERAYRQKPFAMISLIGRGASALRDLADAFRFTSKEP